VLLDFSAKIRLGWKQGILLGVSGSDERASLFLKRMNWEKKVFKTFSGFGETFLTVDRKL
jgi:hypothetical protein